MKTEICFSRVETRNVYYTVELDETEMKALQHLVSVMKGDDPEDYYNEMMWELIPQIKKVDSSKVYDVNDYDLVDEEWTMDCSDCEPIVEMVENRIKEQEEEVDY